ncbi:MAG: hypothetical protein H7Z74_06365 [Anaerolineae bacterium]|nr:hypothetical protein [Gemmatimonadaceae bacterium]
MPSSALRPRSATELIDASFQLLRQIYPQCVMAMAAIFVPFIVLRIVLPESMAPMVNLASQLFQPLALAAIILLVSNSYLGGGMLVSTAIGAVLSRFGALMLVSFIQGFLILFGVLLLIVPGFIAFAWTFAMPQAVMLEGMTASKAFARSRDWPRIRSYAFC